MSEIAALYVVKDGCYYGIPGVDPWDKDRDAVCRIVEPAKPAVYECEPLLSVDEENEIGGAA